MLQDKVTTGLLFLAGIWAGSCGFGGPGHIAVFVGAVSALIMITIGSSVTTRYGNGLLGFNAVLVGCAAYTFFSVDLPSWHFVAAVFLTLPVKWLLDVVFTRAGMSSLTLPFILVTWLLLYAGPEFGASTYVSESIVSVPPLSVGSVLMAWLKGISQVFLIDSWVAGVLMLIGLLMAGRRVALWAMTGSAVGMVVAAVCGCGWSEIAQGLWGFSPVLTAIAVGATFRQAGASWKWDAVAVIAVVLTVFVQWLIAPLLAAAGLPVLTLPFCLVTWFVLLARWGMTDLMRSKDDC